MKRDFNRCRRMVGLLLGCVASSGLFLRVSRAQEGQLAGAAVAYALQPAAQRSDTTLNADYGRVFDEVWKTVQQRFYDPKLRGVDWKGVRATYVAQLKQVHNLSEFRFLVNRMLAELHASHTDYVTSDDIEYYVLQAVKGQDLRGDAVPQIGITGRAEPDGYHIQAALNGSPAAGAGLKGGDVIVAGDGEPFLSAGSLRGKDGQPVRLTVRSIDGASRVVTVVPTAKNALRAFLDATRDSVRVLNVNGRRIGYIHLWTMANEEFRRAMEASVLGKLHDTDGLILDLRDGYGGNPFGFVDVFLRPDVSWEAQGHDGRRQVSFTGYGKPMVVLINGGTRSAKEFLTYQFKVAHRATVIGTRTAGAFLGATFVPIGTNGMLELAVEGLLVDGAALENRGVEPDIAVAPADAYTAADAQLLRAERLLSPGPSGPGQIPATNGVIHVN